MEIVEAWRDAARIHRSPHGVQRGPRSVARRRAANPSLIASAHLRECPGRHVDHPKNGIVQQTCADKLAHVEAGVAASHDNAFIGTRGPA